MKTLFISKYPAYGNSTFDGRVGCVVLNNSKLWITGLQPANQFIIDSYEFDKYTIFVDYEELYKLAEWEIKGKQVDIIIRGCYDEAEALFALGTDINLNFILLFSKSKRTGLI
jgi:hypothetical protein